MWRFIHFYLALVSGIFIVLLSVTGIVLSAEPVFEYTRPYHVAGSESLTIRDLVQTINKNYDEVFSITRDENGFISIDSFEGKFYIDPFTGNQLGPIIETPELFDFFRTLHRSLFLGSTGRFISGVTAIFLLLSCFSGIVLTVRKQGSMKAYFSKVIDHGFFQDYHTRLGRLSVVIYLIIASSGVYLFLEQFSVITVEEGNHTPVLNTVSEARITAEEFPIFREYEVSNLVELTFPFMEDPAEYYELKLEDSKFLINQFTGKIISKVEHNTMQSLFELSFMLHTGEGHPLWSILLGLSAIGLLFFVYSGFAIYLKKEKSKIVNPFPKEEISHLILVGSEHGGTTRFAQYLQEQLLAANKKSYVTSLDNFEPFQKLEQLIIFTSTYGNGEPPSNARNFEKLITRHVATLNPFQYCIVGFGSTDYPNFCQYAKTLDKKLNDYNNTKRLVDLFTINKKNLHEFQSWLKSFSTQLNISSLQIPEKLDEDVRLTAKFKVVQKTVSPNKVDNTFLLEFTSETKGIKKFQSGDLLVIKPNQSEKERFYSLAKTSNGSFLLSVKKHFRGLGSTFLDALAIGGEFEAALQKNSSFHLPRKAKSVIMIANGTGIAPFLGMITNNSQMKITLYWGGQSPASLSIYKDRLDHLLKQGKLENYVPVFSRFKVKEYVQDVILKNKNFFLDAIENKTAFMLCGSTEMKDEVLATLEVLLNEKNCNLEAYRHDGLIIEDCY